MSVNVRVKKNFLSVAVSVGVLLPQVFAQKAPTQKAPTQKAIQPVWSVFVCFKEPTGGRRTRVYAFYDKMGVKTLRVNTWGTQEHPFENRQTYEVVKMERTYGISSFENLILGGYKVEFLDRSGPEPVRKSLKAYNDRVKVYENGVTRTYKECEY